MSLDEYKCTRCGAWFGIAGTHTGSVEDYAADDYFDEQIRWHESGACSPASAPARIRHDGKPARASSGSRPSWHNGIHDPAGQRPSMQVWPVAPGPKGDPKKAAKRAAAVRQPASVQIPPPRHRAAGETPDYAWVRNGFSTVSWEPRRSPRALPVPGAAAGMARIRARGVNAPGRRADDQAVTS